MLEEEWRGGGYIGGFIAGLVLVTFFKNPSRRYYRG